MEIKYGDNVEIKYENKIYILDEIQDEKLIFKLTNKYESWDLAMLGNEIASAQEELEDIRERSEIHNEKIEEYRSCGYTEEIEEFHSMCVYQNKLDDEVCLIEEEIANMLEEVLTRISGAKFEDFIIDYGIEY